MNFKSEKGITSIDVVTATIIITIFISILAVIFSNLTKTSKEIERKSEALHIAQSIIEEIKSKNYDEVGLTEATASDPDQNKGEWSLGFIGEKNALQYKFSDEEKSTLKTGIPDEYLATIRIGNYVPEENVNNDENAEDETTEVIATEDEDLVKIVTVKVEYKVGKETQNVELSTEIVKYVD